MSTTAPSLLRLGVMATSRKPDEKRLPLHPSHLERIDADLRANLMLERGYGERFGLGHVIEHLVSPAVATREASGQFEHCCRVIVNAPVRVELRRGLPSHPRAGRSSPEHGNGQDREHAT